MRCPLPFLAYKKGPFPSDDLLGELAETGPAGGGEVCGERPGRLHAVRGSASRSPWALLRHRRAVRAVLPPGRGDGLYVGRRQPLPAADTGSCTRTAAGTFDEAMECSASSGRSRIIAPRRRLVQHQHAQGRPPPDRPRLRPAPAAAAQDHQRRGGRDPELLEPILAAERALAKS